MALADWEEAVSKFYLIYMLFQVVGNTLSEMALANQEEAVLATFDFLRDPGDIDDEGDMSDEEEGADADVEADDTLLGEGEEEEQCCISILLYGWLVILDAS